jgi:hypothetical protein
MKQEGGGYRRDRKKVTAEGGGATWAWKGGIAEIAVIAEVAVNRK